MHPKFSKVIAMSDPKLLRGFIIWRFFLPANRISIVLLLDYVMQCR